MTASKPPHLRQRRNRTTTAAVIEAPPATRLTLPEHYDRLTLAWWGTIWDSPIAAEWVDADVPGLLMLAQLIEDFWTVEPGGRAKAHAEVRMAIREYGLSPLSRRALQWEVKRLAATEPKAPPVARRPTRSTLSVLRGKAG